MAHYCRQHKPRAKIILLDPNPDFPKQALFQQAWKALYPGMIEWLPLAGSERLTRIDPRRSEVESATGQIWKANLLNAIPPQQSGAIARQTGLANAQGWCEVDQRSFASKRQRHIHVIGDACEAGEMPKTAHAASIQGKICAAAISLELLGEEMPEAFYSNGDYNLLSPRYGISSSEVYRLKDGRITRVSGGQSPLRASKKIRRKEAQHAEGWYKAVIAEMLAV
jgi:sulfide dehydrogenase [flavocytochrome c] flavoprotein subunit